MFRDIWGTFCTVASLNQRSYFFFNGTNVHKLRSWYTCVIFILFLASNIILSCSLLISLWFYINNVLINNSVLNLIISNWSCLVGLWFIATFNNILVISWRWPLLVEETGVPRENHWHDASHWQTIVSINIACQQITLIVILLLVLFSSFGFRHNFVSVNFPLSVRNPSKLSHLYILLWSYWTKMNLVEKALSQLYHIAYFCFIVGQN